MIAKTMKWELEYIRNLPKDEFNQILSLCLMWEGHEKKTEAEMAFGKQQSKMISF